MQATNMTNIVTMIAIAATFSAIQIAMLFNVAG